MTVSVKKQQKFNLLSKGVVVSPSNSADKTETLQVDVGKTIRIQFTSFAVTAESSCLTNYVQVIDKDGTVLLDKSCGFSTHDPSSPSFFLPPIITSKSNSLDIVHHREGNDTVNNWSLTWTAVTPGAPFQSL